MHVRMCKCRLAIGGWEGGSEDGIMPTDRLVSNCRYEIRGCKRSQVRDWKFKEKIDILKLNKTVWSML